MSTTNIHLPDVLPFPIKILALPEQPPSTVKQGTRLVKYSYQYETSIPSTSSSSGKFTQKENRIGTWDAPFEGQLKSWKIRVGDTVTLQQARERPALVIIEACKHEVQVNKLCALCGMDMEHFDYTGRPESARATIQMTHLASGPVVSFEEAQRIERETAEQLLKSRKLSLIVDLDQTIVHATVDPTVGDWIAEGEAWEERQAKRQKRKEAKTNGVSEEEEEKEDEGDDSDEDEDEDEDEDDDVNPNWEALKDVKKFRLAPDNFGNFRPQSTKGKEKGIQNDGCLYYVKPRPGWSEFLDSVSKKYEMHVYTMGTRAYAEEVCAAIDPDGRIFGGRILSRDESGSLTQKSLRRLFPCDTSMVVIIDDRADVWEWSPNLVKVIPYDFFVGIGDINSTFLPKQDAQSLASTVPVSEGPDSSTSDTPTAAVPSSPPVISIPEANEEDLANTPNGNSKDDMVVQNALALEAQLEERPLAKKQEKLMEEEDKEVEIARAKEKDTVVEGGAVVDQVVVETPPDGGGTTEVVAVSNGTVVPEDSQALAEKHHGHHHKRALLHNDDTELTRVGNILDEVHERFYSAYDAWQAEQKTEASRQKTQPIQRSHDTTLIIPSLRKATFDGVHILFSGVIPTNLKVDHEKTEVWRMARDFGAICHRELTKDVTHVVTSKRGTIKVDRARKIPGIHVVWFAWFVDSIAQWRRLDEQRYLLDGSSSGRVSASSSGDGEVPGVGTDTAVSPSAPIQASDPPSDPTAISSDTDSEEFVDEEEGEASGSKHEDGQIPASQLDPSGEDEGDSARFEDFDETVFEQFDLGDVDWQITNDEVDAAMMESDSEEADGGVASGNVSEDGMATDEGWTTPSRPRERRKRLRSLTPSERWNTDDDDELRSPLSKRKKIAADRSGSSKLKEMLIAETDGDEEDESQTRDSQPGTPRRNSVEDDGEGYDMDEASSDGEMYDEDDFLARELEEDMG